MRADYKNLLYRQESVLGEPDTSFKSTPRTETAVSFRLDCPRCGAGISCCATVTHSGPEQVQSVSVGALETSSRTSVDSEWTAFLKWYAEAYGAVPGDERGRDSIKAWNAWCAARSIP